MPPSPEEVCRLLLPGMGSHFLQVCGPWQVVPASVNDPPPMFIPAILIKINESQKTGKWEMKKGKGGENDQNALYT